MILQRLNEYYERKLSDGEMAPPGLSYITISYLIVITENGKFVQFESLLSGEKKQQGRKILLPSAVKRSSGINPNSLWDNASFIFGVENINDNQNKKQEKKSKNPKRLEAQRVAFREKTEELFNKTNEKEIKAIVEFLNHIPLATLEKQELWPEVCKGSNIAFRIENKQEVVSLNPEVLPSIINQDTKPGLCLVTGKPAPIARLHGSIRGLIGAMPTGASLVSFNQDAFSSYGHEQSFNAPVSQFATFAYVEALNTLLQGTNSQRLIIGDTSVVFWSSEKSDIEGDSFLNLFLEPESEKGLQKEAELLRLDQIKNLLISPKTGKQATLTDDTAFYVLGLTPNMARASVRFWYEGTVKQTKQNLRQYFDDLQIVKPSYESGFLSLKRLLKATAVREEDKNIIPDLASRLFQSILDGRPFPRIVLERSLARLKADHSEYSERNLFPRVSLIKAYLNRMGRFGRISNFQEVQIEMDENNTNIGYNLGAFFAVMEKAQEAANPGINTTIRDRYFTSACTRPGTVFPVLVNLSMHHVSKAGGGLEVYYERLKAKILSNVDKFPLVLSLEDQGNFALGYYHQRQELFTKKQDDTKGDNK